MNNKQLTEDELIEKALKEIAGEGDEIVFKGKKYRGEGQGIDFEIEEDEESAQIAGSGFGLKSFSTSSQNKKEEVFQDNHQTTIKQDKEEQIMQQGNKQDADPAMQKFEAQFNQKPVKEIKQVQVNESSEESQLVDKTNDIRSRIKEIGLSEDEVIDLIFQLTDYGYIEETVSLFKGRVKALFRSPKVIDSVSFIDKLDEEQIETPAKAEFYMGLYSLAAILEGYQDRRIKQDLSSLSLEDRVKWIEENLSTVVYQALLREGKKFHNKLELLMREEVADFF